MLFVKSSRFLLSLFLLFFTFLSPVSAMGEFDEQDFRKFVITEMRNWNVPGAAVLLIKDGKIIFSEGFGYRDIDKKLPVDSKTIFPIASCTKTFTPVTVGMLVDAGKVSWDNPIQTYCPELMMYDRYTTEHITPRDILCHRSGLPRHDRVWMYAGLSRDDLMSRLRYLQPNHGFRELFQYNNIVYSIAGMLVEKVSGMRWEDFVKERIFNLLRMESSSLYVDDIKKADNHALPYALRHGKPDAKAASSTENSVLQIPFQPVNTTGPASCINSNIEDMARWIMFQLNQGKSGKTQLISRKTIEEIHSPQMSIPIEGEFKAFICEATPMIAYGLGWVVQPFNGRMMLNHSGGIDGFSAIISFMPRDNAGVIVLTNLHTNMVPYIVAFNYYDRLLGSEQVDRGRKLRASLNALLKEMQGSTEIERDKLGPSSRPLKDYAGTYSNPAYGALTILAEGNKLQAAYRNVKSPMEQLNSDIFASAFSYPSGDLKLKISFGLNDAGEINSLRAPMQPGVDPIRFKKLHNPY
jgi:CubicO group peptidase (beta-lactamase class C family)